MSKFILNKKIESIKSNIPKSKGQFEMTALGGDDYALFIRNGDLIEEICTLTKEEWRAVWIMLTANE